MNAEEFSELQYWDSCIGRLAEKLSVMLPTIPQTQDRDLCFLPYTKLPYSELPVGIRIRPNTGWFEEMRAIRDTESEQAEQGEGKAERDKTPGTESGEGDSKPSDTKNRCGAPRRTEERKARQKELAERWTRFYESKAWQEPHKHGPGTPKQQFCESEGIELETLATALRQNRREKTDKKHPKKK